MGDPGAPERDEGNGVLLYYKYANVPDVDELVRFYDSDCRSLDLCGRVRIAPQGVNVTVGGMMSSLEKHIAAVRSMAMFDGTDFKLASCGHPSNDRVAKECGFTTLSIRVVKELVTFRSDPMLKSPEISNAGRHLSAAEFHSVLHDAGSALDSKDLILLDARNVYETRIGKFQTPKLETMDAEIRQYSDLPAWIDDHSEQLHGKHVLMYCTGGIRCEMASAYIRSKGAGFENVYQLFGGIQRYLEQFPDGGYFKGKNFVFDHRMSVASEDANVLGACLICNSPFDDYTSRCRCTYCRMLVLVCHGCQGKSNERYVCELCQTHGKGSMPTPLIQDSGCCSDFSPDLSEDVGIVSGPLPSLVATSCRISKGNGSDPHRKLRILCLHGFRQNASNFKGRAASLAKKLKGLVEFVFVDAPHELPFIYQPRFVEADPGSMPMSSQQASSSANSFQHHPPQDKRKKKFAWLTASKSSCSEERPSWTIADKPFDPLQYQQQTDGFQESYTYLTTIVSQKGPFDGILGFSQGAAMAALFCQRQQSCGILDTKFAILCSGFAAVSSECSMEKIKCPSLHIFGNGLGHDRQIARQASVELADLFDKDCSVVIEHDMGHIIPTFPSYIDQIKEFLGSFL